MGRTPRLLALLPFLLAGCTAGGSSSSSSSPALSVSEAFLAKAAAPTFTAHYTVDGKLSVNGTDVTVTGHGETAGSDSQDTDTLSARGTTHVLSSVTSDGTGYSLEDQGPWVRIPGPSTDPFDRLTSLDDVGPVVQGGQTLEHLRPSADFHLLLSDLGLADQGVTNFTASAEFYAMPDGTPYSVTITSTYDQNGSHVTGSLTETLSDIGTPVTITAPSTYWTEYRSDANGYSIAHPSDWRETAYKKEPVLVDPSGFRRIWESTLPLKQQVTLKQLVPLVAAWEKLTAKPDSARATTVDGAQAELLTFHIPLAGRHTFFQQADILAGTRAYVVWWASKPGSEQADMKTFEDALSTFTILAGSGSVSTV